LAASVGDDAGNVCCAAACPVQETAMPEFRLPLSGNVTQTINPWNWVFNPTFNVSLGTSSDPEAEQRILEDVGSYGKQLGRIGDALRVLLAHVKLQGLSQAEDDAIKQLIGQLDSVDRTKRLARRGAEKSPSRP
jgi:hypothetical protein